MKIYMYMLLALMLLASPGLSWAEEVDNTPAADEAGTAVQDETGETYEYEEPGEYVEPAPLHYDLAPEVVTRLGFDFVSVDGSKRAAEYLWPHSSATGGILLHYTPLPHRMDFEIDWVNHHDYEAEVDYAYRDIFRLDYRGWSLYHNLDHYRPLTANAVPTPIAPPDERDPGADYHVTARSNKVSLRLKWPDRAYHAFASYRQYDKEGTVQQRFRITKKVSRSRDIDWTTRDITAGVNGHFGPIEAEYSHRTKAFDAGKDVRLIDGAIVHNVIPERRTDIDTLKLHTDLTGKVVGSVTLVNGDKRNLETRATVDFNRASGDLVFIPLPNLTVSMKYRYSELQTDIDQVAPLPAPVATFEKITDPMDSRMNSGEIVVRYSPATSFSLKGGYKFTKTRKYGNGMWSEAGILSFQAIPADQNKHDLTLSAMVKPVKNVTARGNLGYTYTHDPMYPVSARNSYKGKFGITWTPVYSVSTNTYYNFAREDNGATNMDSQKDNAGLSASWAPAGGLTINGGYDYFRYKNSRRMEFLNGVYNNKEPFFDDVKLSDTAHVYYIGAGYRFAIPLSLNAEFHQSWSRSRFTTGGASSTRPVYLTVDTNGIGELTDLKVRETGGTVKAAYDLPKGWGTSVEYTVNDYQDLEDKPQNGFQDGLAHTVIVMLSKNW